MCFIENSILPTVTNAPLIYTRYVDDIFLVINNVSVLQELKEKFENISILKFTYELEEKKTISFLDVKVQRNSNHSLITSVYRKSTDTGECINFNSIAPERYKTGVIKTLLHRAYKICSDWKIIHCEIERIKQLLTNNNFPMKLIEKEIETFMNNKFKHDQYTNTETPNGNNIALYYRNHMSSNYKQQEQRLKEIVSTHTTPINNNDNVKLIIYYRTPKLKNLLIKNNNHTKVEIGRESHVVYQYSCPHEGCKPFQRYIGYTECALVDRLRNHTQHGAILSHNLDIHKTKINTNSILLSTIILRKLHKKEDLLIAEALLIKENNPLMNGQREGEIRVLKIF
jgi:hypothetical protein